MLERNCQIHGDRGKTFKFAEVAQFRKFCDFHDAGKKIYSLSYKPTNGQQVPVTNIDWNGTQHNILTQNKYSTIQNSYFYCASYSRPMAHDKRTIIMKIMIIMIMTTMMMLMM